MRHLTTLSILFLAWHALTGQSYYKKLNQANFRDFKEFNEVIDINNFNAELLNACIYFATNEIRVKKNLTALPYHPLLEAAASIHSKDMADGDFFDHVNRKNKEHREPENRAKSAGISNPHIAENIVEGFILNYSAGMGVIPKEPGVFILPESREQLVPRTYLNLTDELLSMWMGSKGHRQNILSDKGLQLGCGTALFFMKDFNQMPAVKATQCFQLHEEIQH